MLDDDGPEPGTAQAVIDAWVRTSAFDGIGYEQAARAGQLLTGDPAWYFQVPRAAAE